MSPSVPSDLPESLAVIAAEASSYGATHPGSNLHLVRPLWHQHAERALAEVPEVRLEGGGETLYVGELSPGCQCCKEGTWDCLFVTGRCNLGCPFCCSPTALAGAPPGSAFGDSLDEIAANHERSRISGISFSGGEPLLEKERLYSWLGWLKRRSPTSYYWAYTNGTLADEATLGRLADLGLDELRFNLAATGWNDAAVLGHVRTAARLLPRVTVEVPAIPWHAGALMEGLPVWADAGVRHLNLHELMLEPGSPGAGFVPPPEAPSPSMTGRRQQLILADGHSTWMDPDSRALTLSVMRYVRDRRLPLSVNDCSLQSKLRQLAGRRRSLAPLLARPHERPKGDVYESLCAYRGQDVRYVRPDDWQAAFALYPDHTWLRLERTAPLSLRERSRWVTCQVVEQADTYRRLTDTPGG
ncbi:MAG: radical SAM protein [Anaerolineae bacterium]